MLLALQPEDSELPIPILLKSKLVIVVVKKVELTTKLNHYITQFNMYSMSCYVLLAYIGFTTIY